MADVPDETVARGVEDIVECDRQLDDTKTSAEVTAGARNRVDSLGAELGG
jgi:hypothetical protein